MDGFDDDKQKLRKVIKQSFESLSNTEQHLIQRIVFKMSEDNQLPFIDFAVNQMKKDSDTIQEPLKYLKKLAFEFDDKVEISVSVEV